MLLDWMIDKACRQSYKEAIKENHREEWHHWIPGAPWDRTLKRKPNHTHKDARSGLTII